MVTDPPLPPLGAQGESRGILEIVFGPSQPRQPDTPKRDLNNEKRSRCRNNLGVFILCFLYNFTFQSDRYKGGECNRCDNRLMHDIAPKTVVSCPLARIPISFSLLISSPFDSASCTRLRNYSHAQHSLCFIGFGCPSAQTNTAARSDARHQPLRKGETTT